MKRHIQYLLCYRQKVDDLNEKISNELAPTKADIQSLVEAAERRGDTVTNEAEQWGKEFEELERLNKENVDGAAAAPCFCWGYRLAKRAAHGLVNVDSLKLRAADLVAEGVSLPALPPALETVHPTDGFGTLGSTESCMMRVMEELCDDAVGLIGVHGMGGVGKSFLMKKVLTSAKANGLFKEVVFVVVSHDVNLKRTQQQIAEELGLLYMSLTASMIRDRLTELNSKGGVLIVVDDLWEEKLDLSLLGIPTCSGSCKVVITTRDRRVCTEMGCDKIIELTTLPEDESWFLFSKMAGVDDDDSAVTDLARAAAKKCDGLPLALTVLGKTMRGSNCRVGDWASAVEELEHLPPINMEGARERLYRIVKLSFDRLLSEEERLCFLFLCLFPEDYSVSLNHHHPNGKSRPFEILPPTYTWYAVGEGFLVDKGVHTLADAQERVGKILLKLKDCGLLIDGDIKEAYGEEYYESVKMHNVVRHVALQIAAGDGYGLYSQAGVALQQWPINISNLDMIRRISLVSTQCINEDDNHHLGLLPNDMNCPGLRTLTLADNRLLKDLPDDFFLGMKALQVLDLNITSVSSFPSSLSCLTNLRVLFLRGFSSDEYRYSDINDTDLLMISSLTNLEILSIRGVRISLFPTEMGNLKWLRYLDLRDCQGLILPPNVLSKMSNLEQLYMTSSFDEWQVQQDTDRAAFVELSSLRRLTHLYLNFENKKCLWQEFDSVDPWPNLTEFHINVPHYFSSGIIEPATTKAALWLRGGSNDAILPGWLKRLMTRTKQLALDNWITLDIPTSNFNLMENLLIEGIGNPSILFNAGGSFTNLKQLKVSCCWNITSIFASDTLLPKVECIELYTLRQLTRICQEGDLRCPNLTRLVVGECDSLTNIFCQPDGELCPNLREFTVEKCNSLTAIIATSEEELEEEEDESTLLQLQDNTFMPRLQKLTLRRLPLLIKFHHARYINNNSTPPVFFPSLQEIIVKHCPQLEALHLGPESLTNISINNSRDPWYRLSSSDLELESLTNNSSNLYITRLSSDFFSRASLLEKLELVGIKELYEIFFGMGVHAPPMLSALTCMTLNSLPQLISICERGDIPYGSFQNLILLKIFNCKSLRHVLSPALENIFSGYNMDPNCHLGLQVLEVCNCDLLTSIFSKRQAAQCLPQLKKLKIKRCAALKELIMFEEEEEEDEKAAGIILLPRLEKIIIKGCPNLEKALVPELLPSLQNLQSIRISDCQKLWQVLDCNNRFQGQTPLLPLLRSIRLKKLPQLTCIWYGDVPNGSLPSLSLVDIYRCDQLSNLFTWRQARCLQTSLKWLRLVKCRALKDVIMPMHVDEEEITDVITLSDAPLSNSCIIADAPSVLLPALLYFHASECPLLKALPLPRENPIAGYEELFGWLFNKENGDGDSDGTETDQEADKENSEADQEGSPSQ